MANSSHTPPVGEDAWLAVVEEDGRINARDISSRIDVLERYKQAVNAEYGGIRIWISYCEYFWSLYVGCSSYTANSNGLSHEEKMIGREVFSLDAALSLWQQGYEATRYRLSDSHELWNRWVALEMELLSRTRTNQGVQRITHLFKNRLQTPHKTWDETSQMFSTFLSEYNMAEYETTMQDVTSSSNEIRKIWDDRETFEIKLGRARTQGDIEEEKSVMLEYLDWEMRQNRNKDAYHQSLMVEICLGLYSRALTGIFYREDGVWTDYVVWLSSLYTVFSTGRSQSSDLARILPNLLDTLQRAVSHCPWSGTLWARYILGAEEAGLSYDNLERIKHAATASSQLDRDGMTGVIDLYAAWCGFLKRRAMNPNATDEDADVAEIGLTAALEDVQVWGKRLYGNEYKGDPNFRLERILTQYLTEKKATVDGARNYWNELAKKDIHADSYNFWLAFYMWEMSVFSMHKGRSGRSPTPASLASRNLRIPSLATNVLARAVQRRSIDWPEKVMEIYVQHCNDYETPDTVRRANDTVHKGLKMVTKRRQQEQAAAYSAQIAQYQEQEQTQAAAAAREVVQDADEAISRKRTRDDDPGESPESSTKRIKQESEAEQQRLKRDRENTSIYVSNLPPPPESNQTKVRQYFRDYGHIRNITYKSETDGKSAVAMIEFDAPDQVQSALLRDGKYFGSQQITVTPAAGTTLYVTNYPPHADETYIRDLFKGCGEIFSVRWPSLKADTHRRFCYVSFRDAEGAAKATNLDGKVLEKKYKLIAKYSNPDNKKQREGAVEEGREIHVTNAPQDAQEADIKALFDKYGTVERVRILTNQYGKSRGTAFVVFATKEQADSATAELDKANFRNHILKVEKSVPKKYKPVSKAGPSMSPSPGPSGPKDERGDESMLDYDGDAKPKSGEARTFALIGIPDTINDARVRALVATHGELKKLTLRPDHGGAILEFVDAATAWKAQMSLDGIKFEGRILKTGSVSALFHEKGETRIDRIDVKPSAPAQSASKDKSKATNAMMLPPSMMARRPVLGSKGQKRGLGFGGVINKDQKAEAPSGPTTNGSESVAQAGGKKSNADFRALLLNNRPKKDAEAPKPTADGVKAEEDADTNGKGDGNDN